MDLLRDELLVEVVIHVLPDWTRKIYVSKFESTPQNVAKLVEGLIRSAMDIGQQHGVTVQFGPQPGPTPGVQP